MPAQRKCSVQNQPGPQNPGRAEQGRAGWRVCWSTGEGHTGTVQAQHRGLQSPPIPLRQHQVLSGTPSWAWDTGDRGTGAASTQDVRLPKANPG